MAPSTKQFPNLESHSRSSRTVSKHQGDAANTWLPGDEDSASAVSLWKENTIPRRDKSAKAGTESHLWNWQALTARIYVRFCTWARGQATLCQVSRCLPEGLHELYFTIIILTNRKDTFYVSYLPTQQGVFIYAGIISHNYANIKAREGTENEKWKKTGGINRLKWVPVGTWQYESSVETRSPFPYKAVPSSSS